MRQIVTRRSQEPSVSFVFLTSYYILNIKQRALHGRKNKSIGQQLVRVLSEVVELTSELCDKQPSFFLYAWCLWTDRSIALSVFLPLYLSVCFSVQLSRLLNLYQVHVSKVFTQLALYIYIYIYARVSVYMYECARVCIVICVIEAI